MFIDVIVFLLAALAIFKGFTKGFIVAVFSLLAFIIGLAAALKLSAVAADYIGSNVNISQRWLPVFAFVAVFIVVVILVRLGAKALEGVVNVAMLGWANKLGGILFYFLLYIFIFSIILFYAEEMGIINPKTIAASNTYGFIQPLAPMVIEGIGAIIPWFKDMFAELENFFENVSKN